MPSSLCLELKPVFPLHICALCSSETRSLNGGSFCLCSSTQQLSLHSHSGSSPSPHTLQSSCCLGNSGSGSILEASDKWQSLSSWSAVEMATRVQKPMLTRQRMLMEYSRNAILQRVALGRAFGVCRGRQCFFWACDSTGDLLKIVSTDSLSPMRSTEWLIQEEP